MPCSVRRKGAPSKCLAASAGRVASPLLTACATRLRVCGGQRAQQVFQQVGGGERVVEGGFGAGRRQVPHGPDPGQGPQGRLGAQGGGEPPPPGQGGEGVQLVAEVAAGLRVEYGQQEAFVRGEEAAALPAGEGARAAPRPLAPRRLRSPQRDRRVPVDVARQLPGHGLAAVAGERDDVEADVGHSTDELVAPGADAALDVRVGAFGEHADVEPAAHVRVPRDEWPGAAARRCCGQVLLWSGAAVGRCCVRPEAAA